MRASLFNLIVVAQKNDRCAYLRTITRKVTERFPCRVIFILLCDDLEELKVQVSATTGNSGVGNIACDMIEIESPPSQTSKIPFLILPHFLPDLPIYLLWAQDPLASAPLLSELQKWATRFIYDSEVTDNLPLFAQTVLAQSKKAGREVADLNWARTENWRELLAATFYSSARLSSLQQAQILQIDYNDFQTPFFCHTQIQALYLQAWLAARLGWKLSHVKGSVWTYETCEVSLHPKKDPHLPPGTVLSMEISSKDQTHFSFHSDPDHPYQIRTLFCDEEKCDIPSRYVFSKSQTGLSLVNEIYHSAPSSHFSQVLQFFSMHGPGVQEHL